MQTQGWTKGTKAIVLAITVAMAIVGCKPTGGGEEPDIKPAVDSTATLLTCDSVAVTYYSSEYYSEEGWYNYFITLSNKSTDPNKEFPMLELNIYQETNEGLAAGVYTLEDETMTSVVLLRDLRDAIAIELGGYEWKAAEAKLEVTIGKSGKHTLTLHMTDVDGKTWALQVTERVIVTESKQDLKNDPYILERKDAQQYDMTMDVLHWDDRQFYTEHTMSLELRSNQRDSEGRYYKSVLWVNTQTQVPSAGTYEILGTGAIGTVDASYGYDTIAQVIYPSYFALADDRNNLYDPDIYFLVQGKVVISYPTSGTVRVETTAKSWWGSDVHYVYEGKMNYTPAETETYDVTLDAYTDLKNIGYFGLIEYSLMLSGTDKEKNAYKIAVDLLPAMEKITGRFTKSDKTLGVGKSAVIVNGAEKYVADGDIEIALVREGIYSLTGWVMDDSGNLYQLKGEELEIDFSTDEAQYYELENTDARKWDVTFSDIVWNQKNVESDRYLEIILVNKNKEADGTTFEAVLWMTTPTAVFKAGEYPINDSMDDMTFYASPGDRGGVYPCVLYKTNGKEITEVWFLTSGSVKIGYPTNESVSVEVTAESYWGSKIHLKYN